MASNFPTGQDTLRTQFPLPGGGVDNRGKCISVRGFLQNLSHHSPSFGQSAWLIGWLFKSGYPIVVKDRLVRAHTLLPLHCGR